MRARKAEKKPWSISSMVVLAGLASTSFLWASETLASGGVYHLDEGSGSVATDSSGSGNNGTISGASYVAGYSGTALRFRAGSEDNVLLPASIWNGFGNQFYIEARIRLSSYPTYPYPATVVRERGNFNDVGLEIESNGNLGLGVWADSQTNIWLKGGYVPLNTWTKVSASYDGTTFRLQVNDVEVAAQSKVMNPRWTNGTYYETEIGNSTRDSTEYAFRGDIDDVVIAKEKGGGGNNDPGQTSTLTLVSGTVAGQAVSPSSRTVTVAPGASLVGQLNVQINSTYGSNSAMAMAATPTWGSHATSFADMGGFSTPVSGLTRTVPINWTAPSTPGTYYVIVAYRAEFTAAQLMSCTSWVVGNTVWNDGNDIADWPVSMISTANSNGTVLAPYTGGVGSYYVPATAIAVNVTGGGTSCTPDSKTLCLFNNRFQVTAQYSTYGAPNSYAPATATSFSDNTGFFTTVTAGNVDVVVKMVNFCSLNNSWSAYIGGTTDLGVQIAITDKSTGQVSTASNALGSGWNLIRQVAFSCP